MDKNEVARLMAIKSALTVTTNSIGFGYIRQMADNAVRQAMDDALDAETRDKRDDLTLEARALKRGFKKLWDAVETAKNLELQQEDESGFGELEKQ